MKFIQTFKLILKVHCGNLLSETIVTGHYLNLTYVDADVVDVLNLSEAANDTTVDKYRKLLAILKDTGCNDQVCTQFRETLTGSPPNQYQDRNGSTYDQYMLFLANQGSVSIFLNTGTGS